MLIYVLSCSVTCLLIVADTFIDLLWLTHTHQQVLVLSILNSAALFAIQQRVGSRVSWCDAIKEREQKRHEPWALSPEPWALSPEPWALNPEPWTLNPEPRTCKGIPELRGCCFSIFSCCLRAVSKIWNDRLSMPCIVAPLSGMHIPWYIFLCGCEEVVYFMRMLSWD